MGGGGEEVGGGGTPLLKGQGCSLKIWKRFPKRHQDPVLSQAWLERFFPPLRRTDSTRWFSMSHNKKINRELFS